MSCVLCVSGDFDPEDFLSGSPWQEDRVWEKGETLPRGEIASDSGFTVVVSEAPFDGLDAQMHDAARFLRAHENEFPRLNAAPGAMEMVLSFGVAQRIHPAWSIDLSRELVALAGKCGLGIEFALYAVSKVGGFN